MGTHSRPIGEPKTCWQHERNKETMKINPHIRINSTAEPRIFPPPELLLALALAAAPALTSARKIGMYPFARAMAAPH